MSDLTQDLSESNVIFVHSKLDDMGLSLAEFRIYGHLARRAGSGSAYPGIDSMAEVCKCATRTAIAAIKGLEQKKMLVVSRSHGCRSNYQLTKPSTWEPLSQMHQCILDSGANETTLPLSQMQRTVIPNATKGNPLKEIQDKAIQIYDAYPRKIAKEPALKAIIKCLRSHSFDFLLEKTRQYAAARRGDDPQFTPYAQKWFNQQRFNDNPATWDKSVGRSAGIRENIKPKVLHEDDE